MSPATEKSGFGWQGIWILAETVDHHLHPVTQELLGKARELTTVRPQRITAVVMGRHPLDHVAALARYGAETVIAVNAPELERFYDEDQAALLFRLISCYHPAVILAGATARGRALLPRVAALADCGLTADCTELALDSTTGALLQTRPAFGGSLMATIRSDHFMPQMATVRPGVMKAAALAVAPTPEIIRESFTPADHTGLKEVLELLNEPGDAHDFTGTPLIVAGGRGMGGPDGFALLHRLAAALGGMVGATRAAVDAGWVPYGIQIGQTGRTVQPRIYLACGISGQIQHLVGMQSSDKIIAINADAEAPIMAVADVAVVGNVFTIISALLEKLAFSKRI